jgi:hypothetical protein
VVAVCHVHHIGFTLKTKFSQRIFWLINCLLCLSSILSAAKTKVYEAGLVLSKMGDIVVITDERGSNLPARLYLKINPGYNIKTGPGSHAILTSVTGDTYAMEENSEMLVSLPLKQRLVLLKSKKKTRQSTESTMSFLKGRIQTHIKPGQSRTVNISTVINILSVKGTTFAVAIDGGEVTLDVLEGQVDVLDLFGKNPISVMAGMRANSSSIKKITAMPKQSQEDMEGVQQQSKQAIEGPPPAGTQAGPPPQNGPRPAGTAPPPKAGTKTNLPPKPPRR